MERSGSRLGFGAAVLMAGLALVSSSAHPADDDDIKVNEAPWRLVLESQLKSEKSCDLKEVLLFREIPLGDQVGLEGRVSCFDDREFDFSRNAPHQKFRIQLCQPSVC